jgi:RES domain-containing protein
MASVSRRRDNLLIDAIEAIPPTTYSGAAWRIVKEGRDPLECRASGGRWDDGTFDVLYTSLERDGAIAEMYFHLKRGQPLFPTKVRYELFELSISLQRVLRLPSLDVLANLGVTAETFGKLAYQEREIEYPRTQDIAEVAHFLEFDGLIAPSARWRCDNAIVFCEHSAFSQRDVARAHGLIDWKEWEKTQPSTKSTS